MTKLDKLSKAYWVSYYNKMLDNITEDYKLELSKVEEDYKNGRIKLGKGEDIYGKVVINYGNQKIDLNADYSLVSLIGESLDNYITILNYMKQQGLTNIVDIGVAHGFQSDMFINNGISYTGIEVSVSERLRNYSNGKAKYIEGFYPEVEEFTVNKETTLGVAVLSLGWGVYVGDNKELIYNQFLRLSEDFKYSLVYIDDNILSIIEPLFDSVVKLKWNFYILTNG